MIELLEASLSSYRALLDFYAGMEGADLDTPEAVLRVHDRLAALWQQAADVDASVNSELSAGPLCSSLAPLFRKRVELMEEVQRQNRLLLPRLEAMMAAIAAELNEIRTGMTAMAGYRPATAEKGGRLYDAF